MIRSVMYCWSVTTLDWTSHSHSLGNRRAIVLLCCIYCFPLVTNNNNDVNLC